ncbi:MAG: AraC family transcriptional regulator [Lachnospiraceae bacterium]
MIKQDNIMNAYYEQSRDALPAECWKSIDNSCDTHFHNTLELMYVIKGEVLAFVAGKKYIVSSNCAVFAPSYTLHYYETIKEGESIILTIPLDMVPSFKNTTKNLRFTEALYYDTNGAVYDMMKKLLTQEKVMLSTSILHKGYVYAILGLLLEQLPMEPYHDLRSSTFSKDVLTYLLEHFSDSELNIKRVASHFDYSESRFSHLFRSTFGYTFPAYVTLLRCQNALDCLINRGDTLIDSAMNSGFENMRSFYRSFKKIYQKTPTQYLKDYIEQ